MNYLKFKLPTFNKQHNELLVDVYKNDTFEERFSIAPNSPFFTLNDCEEVDRYRIHVTPSNYGSVYDCILISEEKFIINPLINNLKFDSISLNGNKNQVFFDQDSNSYVCKTKSLSELNAIDFKILYEENFIDPSSSILTKFTAEVFELNGELIQTFDLIDSHNLIFKKNAGIRDYRIDCEISSVYSGNSKCSIFLSTPIPEVRRISHRLDFSNREDSIDIFFNLFYSFNPKEVKCTAFSDKERTKIVSENTYNSTNLIHESIPYNTHRFFEFSIYDSLGLSSRHEYYKDFYFSK